MKKIWLITSLFLMLSIFVEAQNEPFAYFKSDSSSFDLSFLKNEIGNKRIVALGEQTHEDRPSSEPTFIFFKADKKIHKYYFADILFIEGSGNYVKIHTQYDKPLMVLDKLTELQDKLPRKQFLRVHKSFIINVSHIKKIEGNMLTIKDKVIPISATFKPNLEGLIKNNE